MSQRACQKCLLADAETHDGYAANYVSLGNEVAAEKEREQAQKYRRLATTIVNEPCPFHTRRARRKKVAA